MNESDRISANSPNGRAVIQQVQRCRTRPRPAQDRRRHLRSSVGKTAAILARALRAMGLQRGDIPVEGAQTETEFGRQSGAAHRVAMAAQALHQFEQAFSARQRALL